MIQCCHTSVPFQLLGVTESPRALAVLAHRFPRASLEPDGQMDGTKASQVCWFGKGRYFMHKHIFVYMYCMYWTNTSIAKKWLARYMKGGPDVVWRCRWLKQIKRVHIYTYIHYILMALNYQLLFWRYTKLLTKKASIPCRCNLTVIFSTACLWCYGFLRSWSCSGLHLSLVSLNWWEAVYNSKKRFRETHRRYRVILFIYIVFFVDVYTCIVYT